MRSTVEKADSIGFVVAKVSRNKPSIPIEGKTVMLQKDRTGDTVDRYGRWLRYVLLDGDNFNARLIREGYAHAYRRFPFSKRTEFIRLEEQARRRGIGLWNRR